MDTLQDQEINSKWRAGRKLPRDAAVLSFVLVIFKEYFMTYELLAGPIIGAVVGYCTNAIAVKMLFWPLKEVRIFGIRLPFTPGVIPKEQNRIISKVSRTIGEELLTSEYIAKEVLNDNVRAKFVNAAILYKDKVLETDDSIEEIINQNVDPLKYAHVTEKGKEILCKHIYDSIMEKNPSEMIMTKVVEAVKQKLRGNLLSMMVTDSFIASLADGFKKKIDEYTENELYGFIEEKIQEEMDKILEKKPSEFVLADMLDDAMVEKMVNKGFDEIIVPEVTKMIESVDVATIVMNKMNQMDIIELENILRSVLKKELGYIINFGLIIGFVIGLIGSLPIL